MSDEELLDDEEGGAPSGKPPSPIAGILSKILGYLIPVLISVVISVVIMFLIFRGGTSKNRNEELVAVQLQPKPAPLSYYDLGSFRINTADIDANYFVRLAIQLGFNADNKALHQEITDRVPQFKDIILNILNSKEKNQIDETLKKEQLKEEIRRSLNNVLINGEIDAIYYTEFTVS
ncbi:MAG: flagellar basal body-associated FliL family protein [Brevinema sp.]